MNITFLGATKTVTGSNFLVEGAGIRVVLQGESFVCLSRFLVLKPVLVEGVFSFFSVVYFPGFIWGYLSCPMYWSTAL